MGKRFFSSDKAKPVFGTLEIVLISMAITVAVLFAVFGSPVDSWVLINVPEQWLFMGMLLMWVSITGVIFVRTTLMRICLLFLFISLSMTARSYAQYFPYTNAALAMIALALVHWKRKQAGNRR